MIRGALTSLLVVISLSSSRVTAISCFSCSSTFNVTNTESSVTSCGSAADQTFVNNVDYCTTSYTTQTGGPYAGTQGGIITTISRSGSTGTQATRCDSSGTCYCNTDKCNGDPVRAPTGLTCYQCSSVDYMDNGCGEVLTAGSKYVQTVQGCSACGKTVSLGSDYIRRYWRGCARSVNTADACSGTDMYNRLCVCKTSLCNSGRGLRLSAITFGVSAILATLKISC